jgi:hypothetical protein
MKSVVAWGSARTTHFSSTIATEETRENLVPPERRGARLRAWL